MDFVTVVFFDKKAKKYLIYRQQSKEIWDKRLQNIDAERFECKIFVGEKQSKNAESFEKYLKTQRYSKQNFPYCF